MKLHKEVKRNFVHLLVGLALALLIFYNLLDVSRLLLLVVLAFIISIISRSIDLPGIAWFIKNFDREEDKIFPAKGAIYLLAGALLVLVFFSKDIAVASILILAFGDSISHIVGRFFGKRKHPLNGKKLWEGSVAGTLAAMLAAGVIVPMWAAFFASAIAMFVEAIEWRVGKIFIDDNLIVPLVAGIILSILL